MNEANSKQAVAVPLQTYFRLPEEIGIVDIRLPLTILL